MELGHHQTAWPDEGSLLPVVCHHRRLQSIRPGLVAGRLRVGRPGRETGPRNLSQAGDLAGSINPACRSRQFNEVQTAGDAVGQSGRNQTHSRPRVSNDNPYSESQFKTMKYRPDFPDFFGSLEDARAWVKPFIDWYNHEHYHSSLGLLTPATVHYGQSAVLLEKRQRVLGTVYAAHPERFVKKPPTVQSLPDAVWINRPQPLLESGAEFPLGV